MTRLSAVLALLALVAAGASSQTTARTGPDWLARGERAYLMLEYDSAAVWLRRGLAAPGLPDSLRLRGLTYLGATEVFRDRREAAQAAFAEIVRADPVYAPDSLVFPPRVTTAFGLARRAAAVPVATSPSAPAPTPAPASTTAPAAASAPAPVPPAAAPAIQAENPPPAIARPAPRNGAWALSGSTGVGWLRSDSSTTPTTWRGPVAAGSARIDVGQISLRLGVVEGRLTGTGGTPPRQDLVEGWALVGARPLRWLELSAGPEIRALVTPSGSERTTSWRVAAGLHGPVMAGGITGDLEVWRSLAVGGDMTQTGNGRWQGADAGVAAPLGASLRLRLGYRLDDLVAGARRETLNALTLTVNLARP
jgi:hypothetical protein